MTKAQYKKIVELLEAILERLDTIADNTFDNPHEEGCDCAGAGKCIYRDD